MLRDAAAQPDNRWLQERLMTAPTISTPYQHFLFDSFFELATERSSGMSVGAIPISSMTIYCQLHDLTRIETLAFIKVMRSMDNLFLSLEREKASAENKKTRYRK